MAVKEGKLRKNQWIYGSLLGLFFVIWILPIGYVGLHRKGVPHAGNYLNNMYRLSCLFTRRVPAWKNYYAELRLQGSQEWIGLPMTEFSEMKPFGYTTRLHFVLSASRRDKNGEEIRRHLVAFIKRRYEGKNPDAQPVVEVRLLRVRYITGSDEMAKPTGRWTIPPLEQFPHSRRTVIGSYKF